MNAFVTAEPPMLLTMRQAAHTLNLSPSTVNALAASGELTSIKIGKRRLVPRQVLTAFVDERIPPAGRKKKAASRGHG